MINQKFNLLESGRSETGAESVAVAFVVNKELVDSPSFHHRLDSVSKLTQNPWLYLSLRSRRSHSTIERGMGHVECHC